MSKNLIGRFYFKQTKNGNLIGEFSNNLSTRNSTESADLVLASFNQGDFVGEYNSTWQEDDNTGHFTNLSITKKHKDIYTLQWQRDNQIIFWGEGFIANDILIGDYRDFKTIPSNLE